MNALITGSLGFVGRHLSTELIAHGYAVSGMDLTTSKNTTIVDLADKQAVHEFVRIVQPDVLFHLAAISSIPLSWLQPQKTYETNVIGTINLLEAVRAEQSSCCIIIVGSSYQYGAVNTPTPISEDAVLFSGNPYAASKKAQEEISTVYASTYSIDIRYTRSFNHIGPGQGAGFLIPDLCRGIAQVERGEAELLKVGNLEAIRDFTDVRDIARAYRLISERGAYGERYNVGSGTGRKVRDILDMLLEMAKREIPVQSENECMRHSDLPVLVCDSTKLQNQTGWKPEIPFEQTLHEALEYYRKEA